MPYELNHRFAAGPLEVVAEVLDAIR
jgi:hypothetical protein